MLIILYSRYFIYIYYFINILGAITNGNDNLEISFIKKAFFCDGC